MYKYGEKLNRNDFMDKVDEFCKDHGITRIVSTTPFNGTANSAGFWYCDGTLDAAVALTFMVRELRDYSMKFWCLRNHFKDEDLNVIYENGEFFETIEGSYAMRLQDAKRDLSASEEQVHAYWVDRLSNKDWKEPEAFLVGLEEICKRWGVQRIWSKTPFHKTPDTTGALYIDIDNYTAATCITMWVCMHQKERKYCFCNPAFGRCENDPVIYDNGLFFETDLGSFEYFDKKAIEAEDKGRSEFETKEECNHWVAATASAYEYLTGVSYVESVFETV